MKISNYQAAVTAINTAMSGRVEAAEKAKPAEPIATLQKAGPADLSQVFSRAVGGLPMSSEQICLLYGAPVKPSIELAGVVTKYGLIPQSDSRSPGQPQIVLLYGMYLKQDAKG